MNLPETRARLLGQYSRLVKLNEELINDLLKHAAAAGNDSWQQPLSAGKTLKEQLDYLRTLKTGTLTPANARLISIANSVQHLYEVSLEVDNELLYHQEIKDALVALTDSK